MNETQLLIKAVGLVEAAKDIEDRDQMRNIIEEAWLLLDQLDVKDKYQGWSNEATYEAILQINNNHCDWFEDNLKQDIKAGNVTKFDSERAREYITDNFPYGFPCLHGTVSDEELADYEEKTRISPKYHKCLGDINWNEMAEMLNEDVELIKESMK